MQLSLFAHHVLRYVSTAYMIDLSVYTVFFHALNSTYDDVNSFGFGHVLYVKFSRLTQGQINTLRFHYSGHTWETNIRPLNRQWPTSHPPGQITQFGYVCASVRVVYLQSMGPSARMRHAEKDKQSENTNKSIYWCEKIAMCAVDLFIHWLWGEMASMFAFVGFFTVVCLYACMNNNLLSFLVMQL